MKVYRILKNIILSLLAKRTIGARALVIKDDKILLVTHTYMLGWYSVGGAVDKGESPIDAIRRELKEEVGVKLKSLPKLFGVYYSNFEGRDDYIVLYICSDILEKDCKQDDKIKEKRWFELNDLPTEITPAIKRRIEEYLGLKEITSKW